MTDELKAEREAFEKWMKGLDGFPYARQFSNLMWQAWQARAKLGRTHTNAAKDEVMAYPECSGDPSSCPENEGYGCCKPNPDSPDVVRDAERYRKFLSLMDKADPVSNEASTIRNIIDDSINLGSECLHLYLDTMAAREGGE